jgi:hypothetical protein
MGLNGSGLVLAPPVAGFSSAGGADGVALGGAVAAAGVSS